MDENDLSDDEVFRNWDNAAATSNNVSVSYWWTPDCGYQHISVDGNLSLGCPDGFHEIS